MPRTRYTPEQIITKLRQAEVEFARGQTVASLVRASRRTTDGARNTGGYV